MSRVLAVLLLSFAVAAHAGDISSAENARIEYLFAAIASLPGAQFIRNGTSYDNKAAIDHLRTKLRFAGSHIKTAEDFIDYCASKSSISGKPYEIRFSDGSVVPSAAFLRQKLLEFDRQKRQGA
jgi:Family of unknown function (DUF5329)